MLSETLLRTGRFTLDAHFTAETAGAPGRPAYNLEAARGHVYYLPPPGGSILSIPFVLALRPLGISPLDAQSRYDPAGEYRAQRIIAAALMAALTVLFYRTARLLLWWAASLAVALAGAFGTQVWSTASRALWSDTWAIALLGYVVFRLAALELQVRPLRPEWLATLLGLLFFARPTSAAHALVVTAYIALCHRRLLPRLLATGAAWLTIFVTYSWWLFGRPVPSYYRFWGLGTSAGWQPLLANLLSPSRGLLVCVPLAPLVLYLLARYGRRVAPPLRRLAVLGLAGMAGQLLILALWYAWWGGHSYGARLTTGLVPWLVLVGIVAVRAGLDARAGAGLGHRPLERAAAAAFVALSVFIQARGALSEATQRWNLRPVDVDHQPAIVWSWRYPQWLAGLVPPPGHRQFAPLPLSLEVPLGARESEKYVREGWSWPEGELRWSDAGVAELAFALSRPEPLVLRLKARPAPLWPRHGGQPLTVELNGRAVAHWTLSEASATVYTAGLEEALGERNRLRLVVPEAPGDPSLGADQRPLRTAVYWMRLDPYPRLGPGTPLALGEADAGQYLGAGWGEGEGAYRWTVRPRAEVYFTAEDLSGTVLRLKLHPFPMSGRGQGQRLYLALNGELIGTLSLREPDARVHALPLLGRLRRASRLELELPDAVSPFGLTVETRRLGVAVHWLRLDPFPVLTPERRLTWDREETAAFLGDGWGEREGATRWTVALTAEVLFAVRAPDQARTLHVEMEPFLHQALRAQRVRLELNKQPLGALTLDRPGRQPHSFTLPGGALAQENVLRLSLPDARSPASLGASRDRRLLGVRVSVLELRR